MKQAVLSQFNLPWLPILALLLFVACFALYTYWTFSKNNVHFYNQAAHLPLEEDKQTSFDAERIKL